MKRYKVTIKDRPYWYASDTIYINKGKTASKTKFLGRADATEETLRLKEVQFQQDLISVEAKERTKYWSSRIADKAVYDLETIERLELLRAQLYRAKADLGEYADSALEMAFLIDFIYNSNRIEGSRIPRAEVKRLVTDARPDKNDEVSNTRRALAFANEKFLFSDRSLETLHKMLLAHEPAKHGFRKETVVVGNDATLCPPDQIKDRLQALFAWYEENKFKMYPPELAFTFYHRYERIHPFIDGNGRTGRLLMNLVLRRMRYHPIIIWNKQRAAQFSAFEKSVDGRLVPFLRFMNEQMGKTYKTYLDKIKPAIDFEKRVEFFLSPSE